MIPKSEIYLWIHMLTSQFIQQFLYDEYVIFVFDSKYDLESCNFRSRWHLFCLPTPIEKQMRKCVTNCVVSGLVLIDWTFPSMWYDQIGLYRESILLVPWIPPHVPAISLLVLFLDIVHSSLLYPFTVEHCHGWPWQCQPTSFKMPHPLVKTVYLDAQTT